MAITRRDFLTASLGASTLVTLGGRPCCAGNPLDLLARTATARRPRGRRHHPDRGAACRRQRRAEHGRALRRRRLRPQSHDPSPARRPGCTRSMGCWASIRNQAFDRLYKEGCLTIVQGVGYANHSQQHEAAMRACNTAQPERTTEQSGWLGRAVDGAVGRRGPEKVSATLCRNGPAGALHKRWLTPFPALLARRRSPLCLWET